MYQTCQPVRVKHANSLLWETVATLSLGPMSPLLSISLALLFHLLTDGLTNLVLSGLTAIDVEEVGEEKLTCDFVLKKYKKLFTGIGHIQCAPAEIKLKANALPVQKPPRRIPVAMRDEFQEEINSMVKAGILTKLDKNQAMEWLNSFAVVRKPSSKLRVCLDPTDLNPHIIHPVCNSNTLDDIVHKCERQNILHLCTPLEEKTPSPSNLIGHQFKGLCPTFSSLQESQEGILEHLIEKHFCEKLYHDKKSRTLADIPTGSTAAILDHRSNTWTVDHILDRSNRSYCQTGKWQGHTLEQGGFETNLSSVSACFNQTSFCFGKCTRYCTTNQCYTTQD